LTKRPNRRRTWMVQSYSLGCVNVHLMYHMLPWAYPSPQPERHLDRLSHFCTAYGWISSGVSGHVLSPKIAPFAWGDLDSPESTSQTAFRSVQPFLQGRRTWTVESYSLGCANVHPSFFLMHTRIHNPNGISIISAVVAELTTVTDRQTDRAIRSGR